MIAKLRIGLFATLGAIFSVATAHAEDAPVAPHAMVYCTVCHGVQLMGNATLNAPRLSGMDAWYVKAQLHAFKKGWRGKHPDDRYGAEMQPMVGQLTDGYVKTAARFVSETVSPPPVITTQGDPASGAKLYATCATCHGDDGNGKRLLGAPALTGHNDWYLVRQLENYRAGIRGYEPSDKRGQQMRAAAASLEDDAAILNVVAYIMTLNSNSTEN